MTRPVLPAARWVLLGALLAAALLAGIATGSITLAPAVVWHALLGSGDATQLTVVRDLRLPRVVLAALVGAGLGVSGAALQGTMRNPLAEPYLLGVSGGAAVGAVVAVALGVGLAFLPLAAFVGALAAIAVAFAVAHVAGTRSDSRVLLMAGVVVGAFANAAIMVVIGTAPPSTVRDATWWMMGSVAAATWAQNGWLAAYLLLGGSTLVAWARQIDVLALGEDAAAGLGLDPERAARRIFACASLLAAATVAAAGLIGFVGLVVPHIARAVGLRRHRPLLVASALLGATLLVIADIAARTARPPAELPVGAVTAVVGVPFFLLRVRRLT